MNLQNEVCEEIHLRLKDVVLISVMKILAHKWETEGKTGYKEGTIG